MLNSNRMRWLNVILLAVMFMALGVTSAEAQPSSDPIIFDIQGDLWAWDGSDQPMTQLTTWGMNGYPVLSPDGTRVAYTSGAAIFADWLKTVNGAGGFSPPENIWVLDLSTRKTFRVADQPADAKWDGPVAPGKYTLRSRPSWSPDSQQLAWIDLLMDTITFTGDQQVGTVQIVVYDLVTAATRVLDSFPLSKSFASSDVFEVQWGESGIAVEIGLLEYTPSRQFRVYEPSGRIISEILFGDDSRDNFFHTEWITDRNQDYVFVISQPDKWLDWRTGRTEPLTGIPELYSLSAPDGASFALLDKSVQLTLPGQAPIDLGEHIRPFGIARDGQSVLYGRWETNPANGYLAYTVIVQSRDQMIEIGRYNSIQPVWGPTGWRIRQ